MEPTKDRSLQRFRPAPIIWALGIVLPLLTVGFLAYVFLYEMQPYFHRVTLYYDDFRIVGSTSQAHSLCAEGVLPRNIIVEELTYRRISPGDTVLETGQRIELSTITWDSAVAMSPNGPSRVADGEDMVEMLEPTELGSKLSVHFKQQRYRSLRAASSVRIYNTANGQALDVYAKWADVERVFGKPKKKRKERIYHHKWVQRQTESDASTRLALT